MNQHFAHNTRKPPRLDLHGAFIRRADLSFTNLEHANLSGADCTNGNFRGSNFLHANLNGTILRGADLSGAQNLTEDQIGSAIIDHETILPDYLADRPAMSTRL